MDVRFFSMRNGKIKNLSLRCQNQGRNERKCVEIQNLGLNELGC